MRKTFYRVLLGLFLVQTSLPALKAGGDDTPVGARRIALGGAFTAVKGDLWCLWTNPAGLAGTPNPTAGAFFERRYLLPDLNSGSAGFTLPFKTHHWAGIDINTFGISQYYNESRIGLTYATNIVERLRFGARFNYMQASIPGYGSSSTFFVDAGIQADVTKTLVLGARIYNSNRARLDKELGEDVPTILSLGIAWTPSDKLMLVSDVEKYTNFGLSWRGGIEYKFMPKFCARMGMSTAPTTVNGGIGVMLDKLQVDVSSSWHEQLGFTPGFGLTWRFAPKKQEPAPAQ